MFCMLKKKNVCPAYVLKHNSSCEKKYSFNESKWRRIALFCSKRTISVIKRNNV